MGYLVPPQNETSKTNEAILEEQNEQLRLVAERIDQISSQLGNHTAHRSNHTQAIRLLEDSDLDTPTFLELCTQATDAALQVHPTRRNRMPYFFGTLRNLIDQLLASQHDADAAEDPDRFHTSAYAHLYQ